MRELREFKNLHSGKDIYVVASGKSMDYIDPSFFEGKITIGINQVYKKFVTDYLVRKEGALLLEVLRQCDPKTIHFISRGDCGNSGNTNKILLQDLEKHNPDISDKIVCFEHRPNTHRVPPPPQHPNELLVSQSTIATGIYLAAYMGAKNIILCGHDCGTIDGEKNFDGYHTAKTQAIAGGNYVARLEEFQSDTMRLRDILKAGLGCNIVSINPWINMSLEGHTQVPASIAKSR